MRKTQKEIQAEQEARQAAEEQTAQAEAPEPKETHTDRLKRERDEATDSWKRALADYKNLRKRTLVDIDNAVHASKHSLLFELLLVLDYLEMALQTKCETEEGKNLLFGVDMTRNQMLAFLESQGVKEMEAGEVFDPDKHQAMETIESTDVEPGTILETVRKGYTLGDKVLRYTQVKVAAEPGSDKAPQGEDSESSED